MKTHTLDLELFHLYGRTDSTGLRRLITDGKEYMGDLGADGRTVLKSSETLVTLYKAKRGHIIQAEIFISPLQLALNMNIMSN
jgi:hypothetical protein